MYKCVVTKVAVVSIKEDYLIFYRGGATYFGKLGHGFKSPVSIHITIWCVMECLVQWNVEVEILILIIGLVNNYGWHK